LKKKSTNLLKINKKLAAINRIKIQNN